MPGNSEEQTFPTNFTNIPFITCSFDSDNRDEIWYCEFPRALSPTKWKTPYSSGKNRGTWIAIGD